MDPSMGPNMGAITSQLSASNASAAGGRPIFGLACMTEQDMGAGLSIQGKTGLPTIQGIMLLGSGTNFGAGSIIDKLIQLMKQVNVSISEHGQLATAGVEAATGGEGGGGDSGGAIESPPISSSVLSNVSFDDIGPPPPIMNASNSRAATVSSDDGGGMGMG